jgi:hypothetical protein
LIAEKASDFLTIYGKPVYVINEMSGQPISLLRLGYPEVDTGLFTDDDFMMYNNVSTEFQEFIEGPYSVVLKYTGLRWLGESDCYILALVVQQKNMRWILLISFLILSKTLVVVFLSHVLYWNR